MERKIKLHIDSVGYKEKPNDDGAITNRLKEASSLKEVTINQLVKAIETGHTFTAIQCENGKMCEAGFKSADIIVLDFDDGLSVEEVTKRLKAHQITLNIVYPTFRYGILGERFRVVVLLDETIENFETYKKLIKGLLSLFEKNEVDQCSSVASQRFKGTNKKAFTVDDSRETCTDILMNLYKRNVEPAEKAEEQRKLEARKSFNPSVEGEEELEQLIDSFDLKTWLESADCLFSFKKSYKKGSGTCFNPCPVCGHSDNFIVEGNKWYCHNVKDGGSIIQLLEQAELTGFSPKEAVEYFKYKILGINEEEDKANWKRQKEAEEWQEFKAAHPKKSPNNAKTAPAIENKTAVATDQKKTEEKKEAGTTTAAPKSESPSQIDVESLTAETILEDNVFLTLLNTSGNVAQLKLKKTLMAKAKSLNVATDFEEYLKAYQKDLSEFKRDKRNEKALSKKLPPFIIQETDKNGNITKERVSAPLLAQHYRDNAKYIFVRNNANESVQRYVYSIKRGVYELVSDDQLKGYLKKYIVDYDINILKMKDVTEAFQDLITDDFFHEVEELNDNEEIINFENGVLNIKTMQLLPHSDKYLTTIQIPCKWTGKAVETPVFDKYINKLTGNNVELQNVIMQFLGLAISNVQGWRPKKALLLVGRGDTGKTQIRNLAEKLIGHRNCCSADLEKLEGTRFGIASTFNKRLCGSADMKYIKVRELGNFKNLTGGDSVEAEFKGKTPYDFTYKGVVWFNANQTPKFGGDLGDWVYDRWLIVRCDNVIPESERDPLLLDKMFAEREGIVFKAIMQLLQLIRNNYKFKLPQCCIEEIKKYKVENNPTARFVEECMEERAEGEKTEDSVQRVFDVYKAWCSDNKFYADGRKTFIENIGLYMGYGDSTPVTIKERFGKVINGLVLTPEIREEYSEFYNKTYARKLPNEH